jgi:hypothetical protein
VRDFDDGDHREVASDESDKCFFHQVIFPLDESDVNMQLARQFSSSLIYKMKKENRCVLSFVSGEAHQ